MLGMRLLEMESSDALDVLHVLLEEDSIQVSDEHRREKSRVRDIIYGNLYGTLHRRRRYDESDSEIDADSEQRDDRKVKPYIPPTPMEALPGILGAPMG